MNRVLEYEYDYVIPAYFAVSKYCNIRCSYCYLPEEYKNVKDGKDQEALDSVKAFVKKAVKERFALDRVYLHGAEPTTLQPDTIREIVALLSNVTLRSEVSIQTNGVAVNHKFLDRLGDMQEEIAFGYSVDLPPAAHNKNRQGTYNKVIENIKIARDKGYQHRLLVCVNKDTMEDLDAVKKEVDFYHKEFPAMTIAFKTIKGDLQITNEQKIIWADFLCDTGLYEYDHSIWGKDMICQAHGNDCWWFEFAHDGGVTACNKSYNEDGKFANWLEEPMIDIVRKRRTLYQNHLIPKACFGCEYWRICKGGCPVDRYDDKGDLTTLDCKIKMRVYSRMKGAGVSPIIFSKKIPSFHRQKEYKKWKQIGEKLGFLENENV
jgi:radical SAM protein with 4Fe4S-binding SPASM domain